LQGDRRGALALAEALLLLNVTQHFLPVTLPYHPAIILRFHAALPVSAFLGVF
jgi:hypothetical protein